MKFDIEKYRDNEISLSKGLLKDNPDDVTQRNRLAYWSLKKGDIKTAKEYGTSEKLLGLIAAWEKKNAKQD
jgi:hypothetical protein